MRFLQKHEFVMPGFMPGIYDWIALTKDVDGRAEPGHDSR